jgi:uncharacterized protein YaaN involved in tellurite resistance
VSDSSLDIGAARPAAGSATRAAGSATSLAGDQGLTEADAPTNDTPGQASSQALKPQGPVAVVREDQARRAVPLDDATIAKLDGLVAGYLDAITSLDPHAPEFSSRANDIRTLGDQDLSAAAAVSNRLLERPAAAMAKGGISEMSAVSQSLISLRRTVEELDPGRQGDLLSPRKLLGILPFGDRLRDYFTKYRSSQNHLNAIVTALHSGQEELTRDNAAIEEEKQNLWQIMERLRQYVYLGQMLDAGLADRITKVEATDPEQAKVLREDLLFYVRQKVQDLLTQLAVSVQGYLALDVVRRNNLELIKGVDRATTTTVSALRTAVIVAQALGDQKLVLDQITALNSTTSTLIESTSVLLRQQSSQINEQAASSTVDIDKLQVSFDNIYATMDEIDAFKLSALENMAGTIDALSGQVAKAHAYLDRVHAEVEAAKVGGRGAIRG